MVKHDSLRLRLLLAIVGGVVEAEVQGQPVASYVVRRNDIPISVIAVPQPPEVLGMALTGHKTSAMRSIWQARHQCCNIAAVRIGEYSYCAVGQVTQEELAVILNALPGQAELLR